MEVACPAVRLLHVNNRCSIQQLLQCVAQERRQRDGLCLGLPPPPMAIQASLGAYKHYLSPSLKRLSPTPIPVSDNPARAKGLKCLGKTAGRRRVSPIMCSYGNYTHAEPKQDGVILNHGPSDQRERPGLGRSRRWTWPMSVVPSLRSMLCVIGAGPMLTWRLRPCGRCINLNQLQTIRSADAGTPPGAGGRWCLPWCGHVPHRAECVSLLAGWGGPGTAAEDAALRRRAVVGRPTLRTLAVSSGRTYVAIRLRASHLRAIRLQRLDPSQRAARGPTEILCRYCGGAFLSRGSLRYCGDECRTLAVGQCPGCGRAVGKALRCAKCAVDGKRSDWPGRGQRSADAHSH